MIDGDLAENSREGFSEGSEELSYGSSKKTCIHCGRVKPLTEFYAKASARDKHSPHCKDCQRRRIKAYRAAHPEVKYNPKRVRPGKYERYKDTYTAYRNRIKQSSKSPRPQSPKPPVA